MNHSALLRKAVELHRQGDGAGAEKIYRTILKAQPRSADAQHLLGLLLRQRGRVAEAVDYLINACAALPSNTRFLVDCADALQEFTYYEDAAAFYGLALKFEPDNARLWFAVGCAHHRAGAIDAALGALRAAVGCKPDFFEALCDLAELLRLRKEYPQALSCMQRALALRPDFAPAHSAMGRLYEAMGNPEKALFHYSQAVRLDETLVEAHNNRGNILCGRGDAPGAIASYKRALAVKPDFFDAHYNLGNCFRDLHALDDALPCYEAAIRIKPQSVPALSNYGEALMAAGRLTEAQDFFKSALMAPGEHAAAAASNALLCMNYDPALSPGQIQAEHARLKTVFPAPLHYPLHRSTIDPLRRLRVGYVSADFCNHPVSRFIEPVLLHHDRAAFEVFCYANQIRSDSVTRRLQSLPLAWRCIFEVSDDHAEAMIRDDGIDILVDLAGHTAGNRLPLFAKKPSPVQISYCGYPNTTGLTAIDYYITDDYLDTREDEPLYTEQLIRLPDCFCCYLPPPDAPRLSDPPCVRNGFVTFGSLHPLTRLNKGVLDLWSAVLRAVSTSRLRMIRDTLAGNVRQRFAEEFAQRGIDLKRIDLDCGIPARGHLALFEGIDIALDTFPWSGHTTACEALWMGVPVITLYGNRHAGRMAASVLRAAGLQDWVAFSEEHYCDIAKTVSASFDNLKSMRETLRARMTKSPVGDAQAFTRKFEAALKTAWMRWCDEQPA